MLVSVPFAAQAAVAPSSQTVKPASSTSSSSTPSGSTSTSKTSTTKTSTSTVKKVLSPQLSTTSTQTVVIPAPAGSAEAYALEIGNILAISHTQAGASGSGTTSTANVLELGGKPLSSQFGGSQTGVGSSSGDLLSINPSSSFLLAVAPWSAKNTSSGGQSTADSIADVLIVGLGDPSTSQSASLRVLQSKSHASWTSAASSSDASTDGAILNLGGASGLTVDVLHSETTSSGKGSSYLVSINGNQIGTSGQTNGQCIITIPAVLSLECLTASGGTAHQITTATAGVAKATLGSGANSLTGGIFQSKGSSGTSVTPASPAIGNGTGASVAPPAAAPAAAAAAPAAKASSGTLAFTGLNTVALLGLGLLLALTGSGVVWWLRRSVVGTAQAR